MTPEALRRAKSLSPRCRGSSDLEDVKVGSYLKSAKFSLVPVDLERPAILRLHAVHFPD
jgi:hypothetical protein